MATRDSGNSLVQSGIFFRSLFLQFLCRICRPSPTVLWQTFQKREAITGIVLLSTVVSLCAKEKEFFVFSVADDCSSYA